MSAVSVTITVPAEAVEVIAARAAQIALASQGQAASPWLDRREAAEYLRLPLSRLEKDRRIPCHRVGRRVLYRRNELDAYLLNGDESRHETVWRH